MADWSGILGGTLGTVGALFGGFANRRKANKLESMVNARKEENENWYNRRYNEDATQRADAQRVLTMTENSIRQRNRAAEGRAALMGGTQESVAAEKEMNNRGYADAVSQIAAAGDARKDAIERQYQNRKDKLDDALLGIENDKKELLDIAADGHIYGMKGYAAMSMMNGMGGGDSSGIGGKGNKGNGGK